MYPVLNTAVSRLIMAHSLPLALLLVLLFTSTWTHAYQNETTVVEITLGSYQIMPEQVELIAEQPVILRLVNMDTIIPHNFTIESTDDALDVNIDVLAGETVDVKLTPSVAGRYSFHCGNKMLFMKSHRKKGMEGILIVLPPKH